MDVVKFAVEESDINERGYKRIHVWGCRDLRDPMPIESEPTSAALVEALDGYGTAEDVDELPDYLAPCARKVVV